MISKRSHSRHEGYEPTEGVGPRVAGDPSPPWVHRTAGPRRERRETATGAATRNNQAIPLWLNWLERLTLDQEVPGSNPGSGAIFDSIDPEGRTIPL